MLNIPKLPLEDWVTAGVNWLTDHLSGLFNVMQHVGQAVMDGLTNGLTAIPMPLMIAGITLIAILTTPKKIGFPAFTFLGLAIVANQNLWEDLMGT